jgi:hypothetical protein
MPHGCHYGQPGTIQRIEQRKVAVDWSDLDYLGRRSPESLAPAEKPELIAGGRARMPQDTPAGIGGARRPRK